MDPRGVVMGWGWSAVLVWKFELMHLMPKRDSVITPRQSAAPATRVCTAVPLQSGWLSWRCCCRTCTASWTSCRRVACFFA